MKTSLGSGAVFAAAKRVDMVWNAATFLCCFKGKRVDMCNAREPLEAKGFMARENRYIMGKDGIINAKKKTNTVYPAVYFALRVLFLPWLMLAGRHFPGDRHFLVGPALFPGEESAYSIHFRAAI
jgi:hypothetical protein